MNDDTLLLLDASFSGLSALLLCWIGFRTKREAVYPYQPWYSVIAGTMLGISAVGLLLRAYFQNGVMYRSFIHNFYSFFLGVMFAGVSSIVLDILNHRDEWKAKFKRSRGHVTREEALGYLKERQEASGSAGNE